MYSIGQLSTYSGESVKTLRYWTDRGLLQAQRAQNHYRFYPIDTPARVAFIRSAQALGFRLETIARLLAVENKGPDPCRTVHQETHKQLAWIREQIERLQAIETRLISQMAPVDCSDLGYCQFLLHPGLDSPRA